MHSREPQICHIVLDSPCRLYSPVLLRILSSLLSLLRSCFLIFHTRNLTLTLFLPSSHRASATMESGVSKDEHDTPMRLVITFEQWDWVGS